MMSEEQVKDHNKQPITTAQVKAINKVAATIVKKPDSRAEVDHNLKCERQINNFLCKVRKEMRRKK